MGKLNKPIPDFDKLFEQTNARRKARFFEFLHQARKYRKLYNQMGSEAYIKAVMLEGLERE